MSMTQDLMAKFAGIGMAVTAYGSTAMAATCNPSGGIQAGADCAAPTGAKSTLFGPSGTFTVITNTLIFIIGAVAVIMLIIGGFRYVLSSGNADAVQSAKNTILYAIIGIVVAVLAYAIVNFVLTRIG